MLSSTHSAFALMAQAPSWLEFSNGDLRTLVILAVFAALFTLEIRFGYRKTPVRTSRQSYLANLGTFLLNDTLMSLMSVSSLLLLAEHFGRWGPLHGIADPATKTLLSFVLFDLVLYLWHRANHVFECLWMFHKVHHSDPSMNVSTAFRLHFVEVVLTTVVKAVFVVLTGVEAAVVLANELLITLLVMFHHANIRFRGEHFLGRVIVVPYLHRVHHSAARKEHDNNYGAVFSLWDRVFGTLLEREPVDIGLEAVPGQGILELVKFGLRRSYGKLRQTIPSPHFVERMIAEAAYYRAEKRGFAPGHETRDWLDAENEIRSRLQCGN